MMVFLVTKSSYKNVLCIMKVKLWREQCLNYAKCIQNTRETFATSQVSSHCQQETKFNWSKTTVCDYDYRHYIRCWSHESHLKMMVIILNAYLLELDTFVCVCSHYGGTHCTLTLGKCKTMDEHVCRCWSPLPDRQHITYLMV